jgi:DNA-binding SARP family transcriptional activator/streptogramin lyase
VELRILGSFEVCDDSGRGVKLPAGRERALLAVLLLRRGEVVSTDALVDALWGDEPPSTATKALQGYVSHLRRLLDEAGRGRALETQPPGYLLRLDDDRVDAFRFEALAARGWRELESAPATALATFEEALALWRGPALSEFAFAEFAQAEIRRLEELRLETVEGRIEAMLRLGRHGAVVAELATRVEAHPLRERLRGQLMLALYRSGRQAEALEVYREGRTLLSDELGLEPGTDLQRLERAILEQDPALDVPAKQRGAAADGTPPEGARGRGRGRLVAAGVLLAAVAIAAAALGYLLVADGSRAAAGVPPPALVVIDPASNRVVASIKVGSRPTTVAAGAGGVWVGDARDGTVTRVDPKTRAVETTIGIGAPVVDLAVGAGGVWAATGSFGEVVQIDPDVAAVVQRVSLGDPDDPVVPQATSVGVGDGRVWVGAFEGLARIDPRSGDVVERIDLGFGNALQIAAGDGAVWATTFDSRAKRVEASSGRETAEYYAGGWLEPVVLAGGGVWVGGQNGVSQVDAVTGVELVSTRPTGDVLGIAYGDGAVWLASFSEPAVVRVDPKTGAVEARIATGGSGLEAVFHDGLLWVVVVPLPTD